MRTFVLVVEFDELVECCGKQAADVMVRLGTVDEAFHAG